MKNLFSKSHLDFDFQKFFNLILTEQRAQRVDLARLHKMISALVSEISIVPGNPTHPDDEQEQPDDISSGA